MELRQSARIREWRLRVNQDGCHQRHLPYFPVRAPPCRTPRTPVLSAFSTSLTARLAVTRVGACAKAPSLFGIDHIALEVHDGDTGTEKNGDAVVRSLQQHGVPFLAEVVGECSDQPNLKQIFSKSSPHSLLITEYVQRCKGYEGFFTRDNVAALTEAAGHAERFAHGHVFG